MTPRGSKAQQDKNSGTLSSPGLPPPSQTGRHQKSGIPTTYSGCPLARVTGESDLLSQAEPADLEKES